MNKIKISVIIPFYNVEKYFAKCLTSVISQTLKEIEIILIDDCGADNSASIAKEFSLIDSRIRILKNEKNIGQGYSRNRGIEESKGEYIAFLDSDDWLEPRMYEKLYEKASKTDSDIVKCDFQMIYKNETVQYGIDFICKDFEKEYKISDDPVTLLGMSFGSVWNGLYKKDFVVSQKLSYYPNKFEDMIFNWESLSKARKITFLPDILYNYNKTNECQDTRKKKIIYEYAYANCKLIKEKMLNTKEQKAAFVVYSYCVMCWVLKNINCFEHKHVFNLFYDLIRDIKDYDQKAVLNSKMVNINMIYFFNGDYQGFCSKNQIRTRINKVLKYAFE